MSIRSSNSSGEKNSEGKASFISSYVKTPRLFPISINSSKISLSLIVPLKNKYKINTKGLSPLCICFTLFFLTTEKLKGQVTRSISTGKLNALLHLHCQPINVVVYHRPLGGLLHGRPYLEVGFTLRCFQRLSHPDIATRHCHWHDNRNTRGLSIPVLSYWGQLPSSLLRLQQIGTELSHDVLNPTLVPLSWATSPTLGTCFTL